MSDSHALRLEVLQTTRLKGRADLDAIATAIGAGSAEVSATVDALVAEGLLRAVATGVKPTDEGRTALAGLLSQERAGVDAQAMHVVYEQFCPVNDEFKALMRDWQMLDESTPNDHTNPAYDAAIVQRLGQVDDHVEPVLGAAVAGLARLSSYRRRLSEALARVRGGDHAWISKPLVDSYHTVWFELHEELIGVAGLTRHSEAASGRAS